MTALIILAAGSSSRLGYPKQTLLYKGKTLLEIAIEAGLKSKCSPVAVVLGANAKTIEPGIKHYGVTIINNANWAEGMASSIKTAINHIQNNQDINSVVIMLCDQPFVSRAIIDSLLYKQQETRKPIIACTYNGAVGVPALFGKQLFTELLSLEGQEGARKIIQAHAGNIATIPFEKGGIDIDTAADYESLIRNG